MILIGELSLWVALLTAVWAAVMSFAGGARARDQLTLSGERAIYVVFAATALASAGLLTALLTRDFSLDYVVQFTSANLPRSYTVAAFWAGQAGALLLFTLFLAACSTIAVLINRAKHRDPYVTGTLGVILALLLAASCFGMHPFERLDWVPREGRGMDPLLQRPATLLYSPLLYLGYACSAIPFAYVIAGLIEKRVDMSWLAAVRNWILVAWFFMGAAIILGMWSAYAEPSTMSTWPLTSLKNGSILPWLVNTVLLYTLAVTPTPDGETGLRGWRRIGVYVTRVAAVLILAGLAGFVSRRDTSVAIASGASSEVADPYGRRWQIVNQGPSQYDVLNRQVTALPLEIAHEGKRAGVVTTEKRQYLDSRGASTFDASTVPGIRSLWTQDIYTSLIRFDANQAVVRVVFNPLMRLFWLGCALLVIGGLVAMWPRTGPSGVDDI